MSLFRAVGLSDVPFSALGIDKSGQVGGVFETGRGEIAVAANLSREIIHGFSMAGDPDLARSEVEV